MLLKFVTSNTFRSNTPLARLLHQGSLLNSAQQSTKDSPLFKLRQRTGLAYSLCREALVKHDNNLDQAEMWLKAQAMALGLQKAAKLGDRSAKEGVLALAVNSKNDHVSLLELNCETDFVSKNKIFKELAIDLAANLANSKKDPNDLKIVHQNQVQELAANHHVLEKLNGQVVPFISKLGENIKIRKAAHYTTTDSNVELFGQVHSGVEKKSVADLDVMAGKYSALVALKSDNSLSKSFGNRLCQHVIGYNPSYIELPDALRDQLIIAEREKVEMEKQKEHSPEEEGELSEPEDSFLEASSNSNKDDWPSIMDQTLIMSDSKSVRDFCKENELTIVYFKRFECGMD